ncbi:hypothetical protein PPTG_05649 [Phytophthora nicotianae INRA-310]|uniref:Uncharacterized protein n=1 Tax=Phytophthora nicotianae (strain INRA-310) TaxID=761204 RepID=W2QYG1_PHYN3|nr:hypothetical protein PPTG_05649 [Phytophthora nicotianae INRA-310]ETN18011.1 hypothetical protein PPTG_05649 [Phytophthora nicotianae INRA-310]
MQARSIGAGDKPIAVMRFLRDGGTSDDDADNEIMLDEERGYLEKLIIKYGLKLNNEVNLIMNTKPHEILASLAANNVPMSEQLLLEWLKYVLNYTKKIPTSSFLVDDKYCNESTYLARFVEQIVLACVLPASVLGSSGY